MRVKQTADAYRGYTGRIVETESVGYGWGWYVVHFIEADFHWNVHRDEIDLIEADNGR